MVARLLLPLVLLAAFAGCTETTYTEYEPGSAAAAGATWHDWASNRPIVVGADDAYSHPFQVAGSVPISVSYEIARTDDSTFDVAIIAAADLAEYRQGQYVEGYAVQSRTAGTSQSASIPPGDWTFVVGCRNSFADCDLIYTLSAFY